VTKHPWAKPDVSNDTITDGRTSCHGGPKIREPYRPGINCAARIPPETGEGEEGHLSTEARIDTSVGLSSVDKLSQTSADAIDSSNDHHNILTLPPFNIPEDFFPTYHRPASEERRVGFRVMQPVGFACLFCPHVAKTFGPIIKHLNSKHKFGTVFTPPIPPSPRIVHHTPELTCPKVGDQSPRWKTQENPGAASPELRLHLSEDEDDFDLHDAQTTAYCGPNQPNSEKFTVDKSSSPGSKGQNPDTLHRLPVATFSCPHCDKRPLPRDKIRKHICRHYEEHFASQALKTASGNLVCRHCLKHRLKGGNTGGGVFVTKNSIRFARHLGLEHDLLDGAMISCGQGDVMTNKAAAGRSLRPRLVVTLRRQFDWDSPSLEDNWQVSREAAPKVSVGDILAQKMFRSHVPIRRVSQKVTRKVIGIIKRHKMLHIQNPKITPEMIIRNATRRRTKARPLKVQYPDVAPDLLIQDSLRKPKTIRRGNNTKKKRATGNPDPAQCAPFRQQVPVVPRHSAATPSVDSLVVSQAGSRRTFLRGIGDYVRSETILTLADGLGTALYQTPPDDTPHPLFPPFTPLYHSTPVRPLPVSAEVGCSRWRAKRSSESGKPVKIDMVIAEPDEATERIIPFEEM